MTTTAKTPVEAHTSAQPPEIGIAVSPVQPIGFEPMTGGLESLSPQNETVANDAVSSGKTDNSVSDGDCHKVPNKDIIGTASAYRGACQSEIGPKKGFGRTYLTDPASGCWNWQRSLSDDGYGYFRHRGRMIFAHRWSYEKLVGPIPEGLDIDHKCRNRRCINPAHLEPVPRVVNVRRGSQTKLTEPQVREIVALRGQLTIKQIAAKFGVSAGLIGQIHTGRGWKDVTGIGGVQCA
jgi:hypothetical protein